MKGFEYVTLAVKTQLKSFLGDFTVILHKVKNILVKIFNID